MTPQRLRYPLVRVLATGAMASLAVLAACEAKLPTSDEMDRMTASSATAAAGRLAMIDTAKVFYYVDGVNVNKADADKLAAELIASVNVTQKGAQSGGEVRIVTRAATAHDSSLSPTRIYYSRSNATVPVDSLESALKRVGELKPRTGFTGLMIVDGVITDASVANSIAPDQIVSVDVIKGAAAAQLQYDDPRALNGVIKIVTRKGAHR